MNIARTLSLLVLAPAFAVAACQQAETPPAETDPDAKPGLSISDGTLILPAVKGNPGAAYFTLTNSGGVSAALAGVYIDGAGNAEMHETKDGTMTAIERLQIDPGATVKFERGGRHVMAFELADTVKPGGTAEMTLTFEGGDKLSVPLKVETVAGGGSAMDMDDAGHMDGAH